MSPAHECMRDYSLTTDERLRRRQDYLRATRRGRRLAGRHFVVLVCASPADSRRLGVTVSRKVGSAVSRNRVKRLVREFFRLNKALFPPAHDTVVIARPGAPQLNYHHVDAELKRLLASGRA